MIPTEAQLLIQSSAEAFKSILDVFANDNSRKLDKYDELVRKLREEVSDLKHSLEFSQKELDEQKKLVSGLQKDNADLKTKVFKMETQMHELERTSLRIVVVVVALLTKRVGDRYHLDVEIAGRGGAGGRRRG